MPVPELFLAAAEVEDSEPLLSLYPATCFRCLDLDSSGAQ